MPPVIHWFRRDLRLSDNTALHYAAASKSPIVPVYILSEWSKEHHWTGPNRQHFLCESLKSLEDSIQKKSGKLIYRSGPAIGELLKLAKETGATAIYYNQDPDPFGRKIEAQLKLEAEELGISCHPFHDISLHHPAEILTGSNTPYKVFTPYSKKWLRLEKPKPQSEISDLLKFSTLKKITSLASPTLAHWQLSAPSTQLPVAGEAAAQKRLQHTCQEIIHTYSSLRDKPAADGTSRLSQDLRHGLLSIRSIYRAVQNASEDASTSAKQSIQVYIKELAWREFYFAILHHFPDVIAHEFNPTWRGLPWDSPGENFERWKRGTTGFPLVDAGMRQLLATGFMHNRLRMVTAMFLTKDLHLDWKLGESHFMQHLTDGEIASNNGGWQWSAGTGADASPYFRIQNPWAQSARHDPQARFIKHWIPELGGSIRRKFTYHPLAISL